MWLKNPTAAGLLPGMTYWLYMSSTETCSLLSLVVIVDFCFSSPFSQKCHYTQVVGTRHFLHKVY